MFEIMVRSASYYRRTVRCYDLPDFVTGLNMLVTKQCGVCRKYGAKIVRTLRDMERYRSKTQKQESMNLDTFQNRIAYAEKQIETLNLQDVCNIGTIRNIAQTLTGGAFLAQIEKYLQNRAKAVK